MSPWNKMWLVALALALACLPSPAACLAKEVGYVNILNGQPPAEAFVVERQGQTIIPEGVYTTLEEGDLVKPSSEALLLFTPNDTGCAAVEINSPFTASLCPSVETGMMDLAYNFVSDEFMAAPQEQVGLYATRGKDDKKSIFTLPPQALRLFVESSTVAASLKKTPFLALGEQREKADLLILGEGSAVRLVSPGASDGPAFNLPTDTAKMRRAILGRLSLKTMRDLTSPAPWPDIVWSIDIHSPSDSGTLDYDGRKWASTQTVTAGVAAANHIQVSEPCLLTFKISNNSSTPYYAYLLNYTDDGLVLPVLPPDEQPQMPNLAAAGQTLSLPQLNLELGEPVEHVRLIISENPLNLRQFNQESQEAPNETAPAKLRPAPEKSWHTMAVSFEVK